MRRTSLALIAALLLPLAPAPAAAESTATDAAAAATATVQTAPMLDSMELWILDRADGVHRNGLMRKLPWVYGSTLAQGCSEEQPCLDVDVEQSTAACSSLEFLSLYYPARAAARGEPVGSAALATIAEFADAVLDYRIDPTPTAADLFDGAVASDPGAAQPLYTSFGNAMCGRALLSAYEATDNATYLAAAEGIGGFLLRMQDPRAFYAPYGVLPFVDAAGAPMDPPGGFFDQVSSLNNTYSTMSLWNMTAVDFLASLELHAPNQGFAAAAAAGRVFLEDALTIGADWHTVRFTSPVTARNRMVASSAYAANCMDNAWHRKGSCELSGGLPVGGTLGTDMVEYALAAMFRYDQRIAGTAAAEQAATDHYYRYVALPGIHTASSVDPEGCVDDSRSGPVDPYYPPSNRGTTPTGDPWDYDSHLSFGGFFRSSGTALVSAEIKYYDIVGFGILAELRQALTPARFAHAAGRFVTAGELTALLSRDLAPMALPGRDDTDVDGDGNATESVCIRTEGTLPIAHNGIGLLETLGYTT